MITEAKATELNLEQLTKWKPKGEPILTAGGRKKYSEWCEDETRRLMGRGVDAYVVKNKRWECAVFILPLVRK